MTLATPRDASATESGAGFRAPYRPELEGLRAVAILLVAASHLWWGRISGGIDVFLVVSGYLITVTLVVRWVRTGEIGAVRYLRSLAGRLLPAALLVLGTVATVTLVVLAPTRPALASDILRETGWAALFGQNWFLALTTDGYLSSDRLLNPVEHFWALSMQVQFYLVWLGVVAVLARATRTRGGPRRRLRIATSAIAALTLASWGWSVVETLRDQPVAYLDTSARIWEFGVGALLALLGARLVPGRVLGLLLGWLGLAMIVGLGFLGVFDAWFPGIASLWPVAGTVLVLLGANSGARWGAHRLLGSRPAVWIGGLAFGLYLWHWPVISALAIAQNRRTFSAVEGITIVLVALIAAWVMKRLLEEPWQRWGRRSPAAATLAVVLVAALGVSCLLGSRSEAAASPPSASAATPSATVPPSSSEGDQVVDAPDVFPDAEALSTAVGVAAAMGSLPEGVASAVDGSMPAYGDISCIAIDTWDESCIRGADGATRVAVIVGDSVAAGWMPAIAAALGPDWRVVEATRGACPASQVSSFTDGGNDPSWALTCAHVRDDVIAGIRASHPDLVVLSSSPRTLDRLVSGATGAAARQEWEDATSATIRRLSSSGAAVVVVAPPPLSVAGCGSADFEPGGSMCRAPLGEQWRIQASAERSAAATSGAGYLDTRSWFCSRASLCPWMIDGTVVRTDTHHLTAQFSARLAGVMRAALREQAPDVAGIGTVAR